MIPTNIRQPTGDLSESVLQFEKAPRSFNMNLHPSYRGIDTQSAVIEDIQKVVKNDGAVRQVTVDGVPVPREFVQEAIFSNQKVAPRTDQFPIEMNPLTLVTSTQRQRSMFGPMPPSPIGLAFDVYSSDKRVTNTNGRYSE